MENDAQKKHIVSIYKFYIYYHRNSCSFVETLQYV